MLNKLKKNKFDILAIFFFLILPLLFFKNITKINSEIFATGDALLYTIPLRQLNAELLNSFQLPFWNEYIFSGFPLMANPQVGAFYPINLIFDLFLPINLSFNISLLIHYSLAGIFTYLFLKENKLSRIACFSSGVVFMFSGIMISHKSHPQMLNTIIWLPLILLCLEKFKRTKNNVFISVATIILCICYLGGHPQMFVYVCLVIIIYIIYYSLIYEKKKNYFFLKSFYIFPLAVLIIGFVLFPTLQLSSLSIRVIVNDSYEFISMGSFDPKLFPQFIFPFIYGNQSTLPGVLPYFGSDNYAEMMIYFGISTVPLFIFGFFKKDKNKYLWIFILVLSLLLVLGKYTFFYRLIYHIPILNSFRIPSRNWFEFGFAFSVLVGFGFDYLIKEKSKKISRIIISIIGFLFLIFVSSILFFYNSDFNNFIVKLLKEIKLYEIDFSRSFSSLDTFNYAIHVPIIIILATITIFLIILFKRNNFIYVLLIGLIFLDLMSVGRYFENNYTSSYIIDKKNNFPQEIKFLSKDDKEPFRIFPNVEAVSYYYVSPNRSIHYDIESITGCDPLMLNDYRFLTDIAEQPYAEIPLHDILINNNIISILNTKYIILNLQNDIDGFMDSISRYYWAEEKSLLNLSNKNFVAKHVRYNSDSNEILFDGNKNVLKIIEIPLAAKKNTDYMISFEIKYKEKLDNFVFFDFFAPEYDSQEQEFFLSPDEISEDFIKIDRIINSGDVPNNVDLSFRIFTKSGGSFSVKNLSLHELKKVNDYKIGPGNYGVTILENTKYVPRFYFPKKIIKVNNISEVKEILSNQTSYLQSERFNPLETALVEGIDFQEKEFTGKTSEVNILERKNNEIILRTNLDEDGFLVFSDSYYPGWKAFINGKETKIYKTNGLTKGIFIPKGECEVIFKYSPDYFYILLIISIITTVLIFVIPTIKAKRCPH